jgi:hypothetical protein
MEIKFRGSIKQVNNKLLVSGDNSTRLTIEVNPVYDQTNQLSKITELLNRDENRSQEIVVTLSVND